MLQNITEIYGPPLQDLRERIQDGYSNIHNSSLKETHWFLNRLAQRSQSHQMEGTCAISFSSWRDTKKRVVNTPLPSYTREGAFLYTETMTTNSPRCFSGVVVSMERSSSALPCNTSSKTLVSSRAIVTFFPLPESDSSVFKIRWVDS